MDELLQDLRYGLRALSRTPATATIALLTLAVGIGVNATVFAGLDAVVLRPLPFGEPDRLVLVEETNREREIGGSNVSYPNLLDWRRESRSLGAIAAYTTAGRNLTGVETPERLRVGLASAGLFELLGVVPVAGRTPVADDERPGAEPVVVLGAAFWRSRFGGDPDVLGTTVQLDDRPHTIVGVVPDLAVLERLDVWVPLSRGPAVMNRLNRHLVAIGRLRQGVTPERADAELDELAARIEADQGSSEGWGARVRPLHATIVEDGRRVLELLVGVCAIVLLIACANVAGLQIARGAGRRHEIGVRAALGAGRWRLVRQLLTESLALATAAAALGLLLAAWGTRLLVAGLPAELPRLDEVGVDPRVVGFAAVATLFTTVAFGLVPALRASRTDLGAVLRRAAGPGSRRPGLATARSLLVVAQVGAAVVLLIGAGLLLHSLLEARAVELGFDPDRLVTLQLTLPASRYAEPRLATDFQDELIGRLEALPGIEAAAAAAYPPIVGDSLYRVYQAEGQPAPGDPFENLTMFHWITPGFFRTLGIRIERGRGFASADRPGSEPVAIVNATLARRIWGEADPVGRRLRVDDGPFRTVVGVVADVRRRPTQEPLPQVYVPMQQEPRRSAVIFVRAAVDAAVAAAVWSAGNARAAAVAAAAEASRREVLALDPDQPVTDVQTADAFLDGLLAENRTATRFIGACAGLALSLALIGLYGVVSHAVGLRRREIGVRMALGAPAGRVLGMVAGQGLRLVALGVVFGWLGAAWATRFLEGLLFGVEPLDPAIFAAVAAAVAAAGMAAAWIPARRAARVDPLVALRAD